MLDSSAIPETGTAKVRFRPTVKHHIPSSESGQGFAVPTPTVPLFPIFNGVNGDSSDGDRLSNGSAISLSDPVEGDIFVPPQPSMAPPPPPTMFVLPPPDFMGDLDSPTMAMFQRPSMPPPKPPSQPHALEEDLTLLKAPPMTPPKPPSTCSSAYTPISTPPPSMIPELPDCPTFAPPKPPSEKQQKSGKTPPPKPTRWASISDINGFIQPTSPAATPQMSTPSSFNPQNTAKLYNAPKTSILSGHGDSDTKPKQILLLQDSSPVPVPLNGKAPPTTPAKPICGTATGTQLDKEEPKVNLQDNMTSKTPQLQPVQLQPVATKAEAKTVISVLQENNHAPSLPQVSPKFSKESLTPVASQVDHPKFAESPSRMGKFSPLIDRKLRTLKGHETSRDGSSASPLALLQAAKEREKHRSVSLENGPQSSANIHHSDSRPNSFVVTPRSNSISSRTSKKGLEEDSKSTVHSLGPTPSTHTQALHNAPPLVRGPLAPSTPTLSGMSTAATSPSFSSLAAEKQNVKQATPSFAYTQSEANQPEIPMALLPPPPEFANFDFGGMDSPPDFPPPDPPAKKAPLPTVKPIFSAVTPAPPAPPAKPKPAAPPKTPAPVENAKPQVSYQTLPKTPIAKPLPAVSESQATLLSILQKKMLEMDHKIIPKKETDSSSDEWGTPLSDEETKFPFAPRTTPQNYKNYTLPAKTASIDMRELETKVTKKQENYSATSNGSKKHHGMTFTVRPGTKQPVTIVSKGEPS
ncbi:hypothetical protein N1851_025951 [Merluccius polli]|uniref:Uncharacterized protein n=1 Tax=Merluccius polli TaxID=89951 RepID=A0AA47NVP0_MERPO|nr:hypothetical protein N1851_025951 [Merluccius polli]